MAEWIQHASFLELAVASTAFLLAMNAMFSAAAEWIERSAYGRAHRIWAIEVPAGQRRREALANLRFEILAGVSIAALLALGAIRVAPSSAGWTFATFGACWVAFEVFYWFLHRAMHARRFFRFHKFHHDSRVTTPYTGLSMSVVEGFGWTTGFVLAPVVISLFAPISAEGFAFYLFYNYSGNIIGHVNAEVLPAFLQKRRNSWMMHPVVYHSLHHARFVNHYGFGSTFMDRLMRTEWKDWQSLHERVLSGKPLTHFGQRG